MKDVLEKSLAELEKRPWRGAVPAEDDSYVVRTYYRLYHQPLGAYTVEDLRFMIGQESGLDYLIPLAIERLTEAPLAEGDFYPGDLLKNVVSVEPAFWQRRPELYRQVRALASKVAAMPELGESSAGRQLKRAIAAF